jgi:phage baseplate assembly protein W|tara:strand:+ start:1518 stop:2063 length:546 start_codon:yes stop_codon:yes gene_type:complete
VARPIYQYKPNKVGNTIPLGISLPFNSPSGKKSVSTDYNAATENAGSVFVSTYSTEEQAISNIKNLLLTTKGERYMQPDFGTDLQNLLFEQQVEDLQPRITESLTRDIEKWLPYISLISIDIAQPDHNLIIKVVFKVNRVGANLVINIVADENTFTVGDVEDAPVATPSPIELTQINTGAY